MSREIKFRAWVNSYSHWHMTDEINISNTGTFFHVGQSNITNPDWKLMQYTGLKDKNDKEIYEGDIVQINDHPFHGSMNINGNYQVHYNVYMELCCGSLLLFRQLPYVTIIGNIYENPELLEGEQ